MKREKLTPYYIGFTVLILLVVCILVINSLHHTPNIVLPDPPQTGTEDTPGTAVEDGSVTRLAVTPQTVQYVIETLSRPAVYTRTIQLETLWSGGSAATTTIVSVRNGVTRLSMTLPDGTARYVLTDGERTCVWYDGSRTWYEGAAGVITPDEEQHIPTYEDILALKTDQIAAADYRTLSEVDCVYVETAPDDDGYTTRYWVNVATGLLVASEKLRGEDPVYRMAALTMEEAVPADAFLLPDGTAF